MSTILIVDNDAAFAQLIKTICNLEGYQAEIASAVEQVLPLARRLRPALVLLDVHLDRSESFHVLQEFRQDERTREIPVIMLSGMDYEQESLAVGADAFLIKPFHPAELMSLVARLISREKRVGDGSGEAA